MIKKLLRPWPRRLLLKKISLITIIITALLILAIIGLSIYGKNVGNFAIAITDETRFSLALSEDRGFTTPTSLLNARGLKNAVDTTYYYIPANIEEGDAVKNDPGRKYMAYSFYLKNVSSIAIGYRAVIKLVDVKKGVDDAIRVMVIKDGQKEIYAKPNRNGEAETHINAENSNKILREYVTTKFISSTTVCEIAVPVFAAGEISKYTIVLWIEGWDEECVDNIKSGSIRFRMDFSLLG